MRPSAKSTTKNSGLRRAFRIVGWLIVAVLLAIAFATAWAWSNRYELIERQAITYFDSHNIQADFKIRSANGSNADIRDIRLSYEDQPFLTVNHLQAAYQWRDLLNGKVERLDFAGLEAWITVDEAGAIIDGWRPPSGDGGAGFPVRGIGIADGSIQLRTPFGDIPIKAGAQITSLDTFSASGELEPFTLTRDGMSVSAAGPIQVARAGGPYGMTLPSTALTLLHPSGNLTNTRLSLEGTFAPDTRSAIGVAIMNGGSFDASAGITGHVTAVNIDGEWNDGTLTANVKPELSAVTVTDPERRKTLSRTLSLANALSNVPVAQNFSPGLIAPLDDLLNGSDITTDMSVSMTRAEREFRLLEPMTLRTSRTQAIITPISGEPLYQYTYGGGDYGVAMQASLSRPIPLTLDPLRVRVRSPNGLSVDGVASASGRLKTQAQWRARTQDGRPAQLGLLSVEFDYIAPTGAPSRLNLRGAADYDGDIPGGYAEGLHAGGNLSAVLNDGRTRVDFNPDRALKISRLETSSDWLIEDFEGQLDPGFPLYQRNESGRASLRASLINARLRASRPALDLVDAATLDLQFGRADLTGDIRSEAQDWTIGFNELHLQSETFPVVGTDLSFPSGTLNLGLSAEDRSTFALSAPASTLITPLYVVRDMAIDAAGTADRYTMDYQNGQVKLVPQDNEAVQLPIVPVAGTLLFENGGFTGQAQTSLPRAVNTPINVDFELNDGGGEANIKFRGLRFRPGGLQPQDLAPALRGKIARVDGVVDGDFHVLFGGGSAPSGTGTVEIINMSLGTAPGPVTGLSGTLNLTSLFPVVTAADQTLLIQTFNPGFPLEDGALTYALVPEGVAISRAMFPLGEGQVSFDPFLWTYGAPENRVTLRVGGVEVGDFLKGVGDGRLSISGSLEGTIPVVVRGIDVLVEKGRLEVKNGGVIRYEGKEVSDAIPNEYAAKAIEALKNFNYDALFVEINGPLDGEIKLGMEFTGSNPEVFYDIPFQFDVTVEGELFNIARSLNPNGLQQRVVTQVKENNAANE